MINIECFRCSARINAGATTCPNCHAKFTQEEIIQREKQATFITIAIGGFLILLLIAISSLFSSFEKPSSEGAQNLDTQAAAQAAAQAVVQAQETADIAGKPADQKLFEESYTTFSKSSDSTGNGINDAQIEIDKFIQFCKVRARFHGIHKNWIGDIKDIQDGNLIEQTNPVLEISINNGKETIISNIKYSGNVYNNIKEMKVGDKVKFSVNFKSFKINEKDCYDKHFADYITKSPDGFKWRLYMHDINEEIYSVEYVD